MESLALRVLETNYLPDSLVRILVRREMSKLKSRIEKITLGEIEKYAEKKQKFVSDLKKEEIAINTDDANKQHYEVPSEFFETVLGPALKYSTGIWSEDCNTLETSELECLRVYVERSGIEDGMKVLDLGCGWGSFSTYVAKRFPNCEIVALSNSAVQKAFIERRCEEREISNVRVITANVRDYEMEDGDLGSFDRAVSIQMFEHMKNYEKLMEKISRWLKRNGKLFVEVFCHREYPFNFKSSWMAKNFFSGGTMPSFDLLNYFQKDLVIENSWAINGIHYSKTLEAWLEKLDRNTETIIPILKKTYGKEDLTKWLVYWRMFFVVCSEFFAYNDGNEWFMGLLLFQNRAK